MKEIELVKSNCNAMDIYTPDKLMPFWDRKVSLIVFDKENCILAAKSVGGKKAMIENMEKSYTFCCAWTGQYSTNIFPMTQKDLKDLLKATK